ncbi:MAG TPA: sugar-binding protein, partial [Candidatus Sumerlaeota bacterium]|nr:sugar-binding protein [Candidatus Sumerlaeota bacterium]
MRTLKGWRAWVLAVGLLAPVYVFSQEMTVFDFEQYADTAAFVAATNIGHQGGITDRALETTNLAAPGSTAAAKGIVAANTQGWGQFYFTIPQMNFSPYDVLEFWGKIEGGCATGWSVKIGGGQDNSSKSVYFTDRWERYRIPFGSFTTIGKSDWDSGNPAPFNNITHMEIQLQGFVNNTDGNVFLDAIKVVSVADLADLSLLDFEAYNQSQIDEILLYGGVSVVSLETADLPPNGGAQALKVDYDNTAAQSAIEITLPSPTNMMDLPYVTFWAKSSIKTASLQVGLIDVDLVNGDGRDLSPAQKLTDGWVQYSIPLCDFLDGKGDYWQRGVNWANVGKIQFLPVGAAGTLTVDNVRLTRYPVAPLPMLEDFEAYDAAALDKVKLSAGATSKTLERADIVWGPEGGTKAFRMAFDNSTQGYSMAEFSLPSAVDMTNCDKVTFWAKGTTDNAGLTIAVADKARAGCNVFEGLKVTKQWLKYAIPKSKFVKSPYWNQAVDWSTVDLIQIQPTGDAGELAIDSIAMTVVSAFKDFMIEDFERFAPDAAITYQAGVTTASIETMILPPGTTSTQSLEMLWNDPEPRQWWGQAVFSAAAPVDVSQAYAIRFWGKGTAEGQTISIKAYDASWAGSSRAANIALTTEWKRYDVLMTQFIAEDPLKPCDWTKAQNFQLQAGGTFGLMYFDEFWAVGPPTATVLSARTPAADAEVETLNSVSVTFSEPMDGVVATMLSVNGSSATLATTTDNISFTFTGFAAPAVGTVTIVLSPLGTYKGDTWVCSLMQKVEAVAEPTTTAPTLDGVLSPGEWAGVAYVPLQTVPGDAAPADAADLSAKFYVMHDAQYIYVAVDVTDSVQAYNPATGGNWENDTAEIFFDMDHDHSPGRVQPGGQFGITWDGTILGGNLTADFEGKGGADSWSAAVATHEGGYAIEFRLLRSAFSTPADGATVGFDVQVQDNDGSGRESRLWWSSTAGLRDPWDYASAWGHLLLKGGGPVPLTVNVLPNAGAGTVTANPTSGDGTYEFGTTVTLTAAPAAGYRFVNWTGDVTGTEASILVTMNGARTVTANFEQIPTHTVTVTATPSEGGTVSRTPSKDAYAEGEKVTLTATPATNWVFRGWMDGATTVSTNASFEYTVGTANVTLTAKFSAVEPGLYTLTLVADPANAAESLAKSPDQTTYASGDVVTLTATPKAEYTFAGWFDGETPVTSPYTMPASNKTLTAKFTPKATYALTVTATEGGSATKAPDQATYLEGAQVQLTAT